MIIEQHNGVHVLRDDFLPGGTKSVFLPLLLEPDKDFYVYASPVYGGMQIALAAYAKSIGKQAVIFSAKRNIPFANTLKAKAAGAKVYQVPFGYLSNCQAKAKEFAENNNGQLIQFGADGPIAINAIAERMQQAIQIIGQEPDEIFCAFGSGTLMKGIIAGTKAAKIIGVQVGATPAFEVPERCRIVRYPKPFAYESKLQAPFNSCANYDLKAWEICLAQKKGSCTFFWNVL